MVKKYEDAYKRLPRHRGNSIQGKMFVKDEGYFKTTSLKPRVVMEVAHLEDIIPIAPFCNALADFWHWVDSTFCPPIIYLTGLNRSTVDRWYSTWCAQFDCAVENDFSEFESRVSTEALEFEFRTYDSFGYSHLRPWFNLQKSMIQRGNGVTFRRKAGRMSGVPNTSIGNSIINFAGHFYFFEQHGLKPGLDYAMAVNGDDNVIFCSQETLTLCERHLAAHFRELGMCAEVVVHHDRRKANFCSSMFGQLPSGQYVLAPHPFRAIAKAGKAPAEGFAGPETVVALMRDYSSTPNFWPIHVFSRFWLDHMGYSHEDAPSCHYECAFTPTSFLQFQRQHPPHSDGSWVIPHDSRLYSCLEQEGLIEAAGKTRNFDMPPGLTGLPPRWGAPGWVRHARQIREKLLAFWRSSDYTRWRPRIEVQGDAPVN